MDEEIWREYEPKEDPNKDEEDEDNKDKMSNEEKFEELLNVEPYHFSKEGDPIYIYNISINED